ncbi:nucleotidyltransferase family protein [Nemorincola caseinilytica]|uniref:Nucleotidyltransferase family protein n=1 Tax=Nemorincola caseinilytica TaxID=2054315 RepID=A0ABP8NA63_9BACT
MEVIILAGGLGTRLQGVIGQYPKCMAAVNGRPFLAYLFDYLGTQGCTRVILSLGYKHEVILEWLAQQTPPFVVDHVVEQEPMGTGGGIQLAIKDAVSDHVIVLNGDTMFMADLRAQMEYHRSMHAGTTLGLKKMYAFDRYGIVVTNDHGRITSFEEKQYREEGMINAGVYIVDTRHYLGKQLPAKHSFEKAYLERYTMEGRFYGFESEAYFIDIGIPVDYEKAQQDLKIIFS